MTTVCKHFEFINKMLSVEIIVDMISRDLAGDAGLSEKEDVL